MSTKNKKSNNDEIRSVRSKIKIKSDSDAESDNDKQTVLKIGKNNKNNETNIALSDSESDELNEKKLGIAGRPKGTTKESHTADRDMIIKRFEFILGLKKNNYTFCLDDVTDDQIEQIFFMIKEIRKNFRSSTWPYFRNLKSKLPYLSLTKSVFASIGYEAIQNSIKEKKDGVIVKRTYVTFLKKE
jgi:hypothetical protein